MKNITFEEIDKLSNDTYVIIDIRKNEDFVRGNIKGSINIPTDEIENRVDELQNGVQNFILCYTGEKSREVVELLESKGICAWNIEGGYRAYLNILLSKIVINTDKLPDETSKIERSIIKKYRKNIWCKFTKAVREYKLINDGDKIAVCISGGKDSMLMAKLFQELQNHGKNNFELVFLLMNPGYNDANFNIIKNNAKLLGIPLTVFNTQIFDIVADVNSSPCYLCARMRRGYLYSKAKELGCNKISLGHHYDDVIETILMGMLYSGKIETMMPKLYSKNFENMQLIRPMYLIKEDDIKNWRDYNRLEFIQCACRFTESCSSCGGAKGSKRDEMKELVKQFRNTSDVIENNIFNSVKNINLEKVIGYHTSEQQYSFLDRFDDCMDKNT